MAADLKLAVFDATVGVDDETAGLVDADSVVVMNKVDAAAGPVPGAVAGRSAHQVSARTGAGIADLLAVLTAEAGRRMAVGAQAGLTRLRHRRALEDCAAALDRAVAGRVAELVAEDVRLAGRALGRITGRVDVEDVLDVIFRDFCIGK